MILKEKSHIVVVNDTKGNSCYFSLILFFRLCFYIQIYTTGRSIIRDIPIETLLDNITPDPLDDQDENDRILWKRSIHNAQIFNDIEVKQGRLLFIIESTI